MGLFDSITGGDDSEDSSTEDSGGGIIDDISDGVDDVVDDVSDTIDDAVDAGEEAAGDISEGAGDVADEVSDGDLGGAVDEASDTVEDVASGSSDTGSSGSSGGSSSRGSDIDFDSGGGGGSDPDPDPAPEPDPSNADPSDTGGSGESSGREGPSLTDQLLNDPGQEEGLPETQEGVEQAQEFRDQNFILSAASPEVGDALNTREENLEVRNQIDQQIDQIQDAPRNSSIRFGRGEDAETLSRGEALDRLQNRRRNVEQTLDQNERRFNRAQNPPRLSDGMQQDIRNLRETDGRTSQTVEEEARDMNLDNLQVNADIPLTGDLGEFSFSGLPARAAASFDTFTSGKGFEQLSTAAPWVEKEGAQVIKENIVESRRDQNDGGFDPVDEGVDTLSSPPGLLLGGGAVGGGFKAGTAALAARGGRAATAAKGLEVGAAGAGAAYTGLELEESRQEFQEGDNLEGTENLLKLGTETAGFAGGSRAVSRNLRPSIDGPVRINELSNVRQTGQNQFVGSGRFRGETNIRQSRLAETLGIGESGTANVRGRFNVRGGEGTSEARGSLEVELPSGRTRTRDFESLSIERGQTETPSGQEVRLSSDTFRTFDEGPLFRSTSTRSGETKSIKEGETPLREVTSQEGGLTVRNRDVDGRIIERGSFSRGEDGVETFGDSRIIVRGETSGRGGSAGGGSGSGQRFEGGSGRVVGSNSQGEFVSSDLAGREFVDLAARPPQPGGTRTAMGLGSGGSGGQGSQAGLQEDLAQEFGGQQREADLEQAEEVDPFQIQRPETTQEVVDPFDPGGQGQVQDVGGPGLEETQRDPVQEVNPFEPDLDEGVDQRTDPIQEQRPGQDVVPEEVQDQAPVEELRPIEEVGPVQEEKLLQDQDVLTEQIQRTPPVEADPLRPGAARIGPRPAPRAGIPFPEAEGGLAADFPEPEGGRAAEPEFNPSLEAVLFDIEGEAPADDDPLTGAEVRPIPEDREEEFEFDFRF